MEKSQITTLPFTLRKIKKKHNYRHLTYTRKKTQSNTFLMICLQTRFLCMREYKNNNKIQIRERGEILYISPTFIRKDIWNSLHLQGYFRKSTHRFASSKSSEKRICSACFGSAIGGSEPQVSEMDSGKLINVNPYESFRIVASRAGFSM